MNDYEQWNSAQKNRRGFGYLAVEPKSVIGTVGLYEL